MDPSLRGWLARAPGAGSPRGRRAALPRRLLLLRAGRSLGQRRRPGDLRPTFRGARADGRSRGRPSPLGALPSDAPRRLAAFGGRGRDDRGGHLRRGSERRRVSLSVRLRGALRGGGRAGEPRGPVSSRGALSRRGGAPSPSAFSLLAKAEIGAAAAVVLVVAALRSAGAAGRAPKDPPLGARRRRVGRRGLCVRVSGNPDRIAGIGRAARSLFAAAGMAPGLRLDLRLRRSGRRSLASRDGPVPRSLRPRRRLAGLASGRRRRIEAGTRRDSLVGSPRGGGRPLRHARRRPHRGPPASAPVSRAAGLGARRGVAPAREARRARTGAVPALRVRGSGVRPRRGKRRIRFRDDALRDSRAARSGGGVGRPGARRPGSETRAARRCSAGRPPRPCSPWPPPASSASSASGGPSPWRPSRRRPARCGCPSRGAARRSWPSVFWPSGRGRATGSRAFRNAGSSTSRPGFPILCARSRSFPDISTHAPKRKSRSGSGAPGRDS